MYRCALSAIEFCLKYVFQSQCLKKLDIKAQIVCLNMQVLILFLDCTCSISLTCIALKWVFITLSQSFLFFLKSSLAVLVSLCTYINFKVNFSDFTCKSYQSICHCYIEKKNQKQANYKQMSLMQLTVLEVKAAQVCDFASEAHV